MIRIIFPFTDFDPVLGFRSINDRFVQAIRLEKEGKSSILEIQFADPGFQAIGLINYRAEKQILHVFIDKDRESAQTSKDDSERSSLIQTSDKEEEPQQQNAFQAADYFSSTNITTNIIKMLLALFVLLLFFYVLLWLYNKFFVAKFSFSKGKYSIRVSSSYHISPKQKIIILEINKLAFACGVTSNNINLISKVSDDSFLNYLTSFNPDKNKVDFFELRTQYLEGRRRQQEAQESKTTDTKFATELIDKVKSLKPLD
ncbi:MAG: FliO/MopB family protein [Proteobacteria bacterium]|nr:FliO/MopB family protein [Pseudomonadota bacterium]